MNGDPAGPVAATAYGLSLTDAAAHHSIERKRRRHNHSHSQHAQRRSSSSINSSSHHRCPHGSGGDQSGAHDSAAANAAAATGASPMSSATAMFLSTQMYGDDVGSTSAANQLLGMDYAGQGVGQSAYGVDSTGAAGRNSASAQSMMATAGGSNAGAGTMPSLMGGAARATASNNNTNTNDNTTSAYQALTLPFLPGTQRGSALSVNSYGSGRHSYGDGSAQQNYFNSSSSTMAAVGGGSNSGPGGYLAGLDDLDEANLAAMADVDPDAQVIGNGKQAALDFLSASFQSAGGGGGAGTDLQQIAAMQQQQQQQQQSLQQVANMQSQLPPPLQLSSMHLNLQQQQQHRQHQKQQQRFQAVADVPAVDLLDYSQTIGAGDFPFQGAGAVTMDSGFDSQLQHQQHRSRRSRSSALSSDFMSSFYPTLASTSRRATTIPQGGTSISHMKRHNTVGGVDGLSGYLGASNNPYIGASLPPSFPSGMGWNDTAAAEYAFLSAESGSDTTPPTVNPLSCSRPVEALRRQTVADIKCGSTASLAPAAAGSVNGGGSGKTPTSSMSGRSKSGRADGGGGGTTASSSAQMDNSRCSSGGTSTQSSDARKRSKSEPGTSLKGLMESGVDLSTLDPVVIKRIKNTDAARKSRQKKLKMMQDLERQTKAMDERLAQVTHERDHYKSQYERLLRYCQQQESTGSRMSLSLSDSTSSADDFGGRRASASGSTDMGVGGVGGTSALLPPYNLL